MLLSHQEIKKNQGVIIKVREFTKIYNILILLWEMEKEGNKGGGKSEKATSFC
jgi:hypothetical protein